MTAFRSIWDISGDEWLEAMELDPSDIPDVIIVEGSWWREQRTNWRLAQLDDVRELAFPDIFWGRRQETKVAFCCAYGAARTVEIIHLFGSIGTPLAVQIGTCGGLQSHLRSGDIILPEVAFAREGVARAYGVQEAAFGSAAALTQAEVLLNTRDLITHRGAHMTWSSLFTETSEMLRAWHQAGYLAVDMETATTYAVANHFGMAAVSLLVVWDDLTRGKRFLDPLSPAEQTALETANEAVFEIALALASAQKREQRQPMTTVASPALYPWQRRLVSIAWLTYAAYYLGRSNISAALPAIEADLALSKSQIGLFVTGFFWAYAIGQLVNGQLGDRLSPRLIIFVGLLISALLNLAFGLVSIFALLVVIWTLNGYFQATGWGPILRTLSNWLQPGQRRRISTVFGTCFVAGNAVALLLAGWLTETFGWRTAFIVPAFLLTLTAVAWYGSVQDTPEDAGHHLEGTGSPSENGFHLGDIIAGLGHSLRRFWSLGIGAAFTGYCVITLVVWLPTYYVEVLGIDIGTASTLAALIPASGVVGTLVIGWLVNRYLQQRETVGLLLVLLALAFFSFLFPFLPSQLVLSTLALMLVGGLVYGATSLTLSTMPLVLSHQDEASGTGGLIDFASNIGGGLSGIIVGAILQTYNWDMTFYSVAVAALGGAFFIAITARRLQGKRANNS